MFYIVTLRGVPNIPDTRIVSGCEEPAEIIRSALCRAGYTVETSTALTEPNRSGDEKYRAKCIIDTLFKRS